MARLLVLTDRAPDDHEWKGAFAWKTILALAESHHEVLVITPLDLDRIELTHPRLTITRPFDSWSARHTPLLAQTIVRFRPEVLHTFALKGSRLWPALTVWPYLLPVCQAWPQMRRISTFFDERDEQFGREWHLAANRLTVFNSRQQALLRRHFKGQVELLPLELEERRIGLNTETGTALIPAPVSEWENPKRGLQRLTVFLSRHPEIRVRIVGGWGDWMAQERKMGWQVLGENSGRVAMTRDQSFGAFARELSAVDSLWLDPLRPHAWKFLLAHELGERFAKHIYLSSPSLLALSAGSTANSLSRLYSTDFTL